MDEGKEERMQNKCCVLPKGMDVIKWQRNVNEQINLHRKRFLCVLHSLSVSEWTTISTVPLFRDLKWLQPQPVHLRPIFLHQQLPIHQTPRTEQQTTEADLL